MALLSSTQKEFHLPWELPWHMAQQRIYKLVLTGDLLSPLLTWEFPKGRTGSLCTRAQQEAWSTGGAQDLTVE